MFYVSNLYAQTPEKPAEKIQESINQEEKVEKNQDALKALDKEALLKTEKVDKYIKTANSLREIQNDYKGALGYYKKAIELDPNRSSLHWYIAGVYWKLDNHAKAMEHLELCRKLLPQVPEELNEVDDFIGKLMDYLTVEEKREIAKRRVNDRRQLMESALDANKGKWDEMTLVASGEFLMGSKEEV
jgi:tetratricopeptide (TPR) repeat protein